MDSSMSLKLKGWKNDRAKDGSYTSALPREYHIANFRTAVPEMQDKTSKAVKIKRNTTSRTEPPMLLSAGKKTYEGTREGVGTSSSKSSSYVLFRVDEKGKLSAYPLASWHSFKPSINYETMTLEQAESWEGRKGLPPKKLSGASSLRDKLKEQLSERSDEVARQGGTSDDDDDDDGGGGTGRQGGMDDGGDGDAFDAGDDGGLMMTEMENEDGREGLDVEDDDFDDDDNDAFEDDDDEAIGARQAAQKSGTGDRGVAGEIDDEVDASTAAQKSDWGKSVKEARKGVSAYEKEQGHRKRADDEESDDDDDDDDLGKELLREVMRANGDEKAASAAEALPPSLKRPLAPPAEAPPKRPKTELTKKLAVTEKEAVELIHASPRLTVKDLIAKFKVFLTDKELKAQFMKLIKDISTMKDDGTGGKVVKLKDSILDKYDLQ